MIVSDFKPDWDSIWTAEEAKKELTGFKFRGPGWYIGDNSVFLVFPVGEVVNPWIQEWSEDQRFYFMCYDSRNPANAFDSIVNAPVRQDER